MLRLIIELECFFKEAIARYRRCNGSKMSEEVALHGDIRNRMIIRWTDLECYTDFKNGGVFDAANDLLRVLRVSE